MRRSSVLVFLMCALAPFRTIAQTQGIQAADAPVIQPTEYGSELQVTSGGGVVGIDAYALEGTGIKAYGQRMGLDATGGIYGARLNGGLQLVPGTGGLVGSEFGPPEAGLLYAGTDGTLWYRTVSATQTNPGIVIALSRQVPPGAISAYAGASAPAGYLLCNGQAVSRTTYAALFSAIGTSYGAGDGSTTFNVPDLRGEFLRGLDAGRGVDAGRTLGSAQPADIGSHNHPFAGNSPFRQSMQFSSSGGGYYALSSGSVNNAGSTGNNTGTETRPRNVAVNYIVAY